MKSAYRLLRLGVPLFLFSFIIALGVMVLRPIDSAAYSYSGLKWPVAHADYWLDIAGWDPNLIINPSFTWTNAAPSPFYFTYKGHTIYGHQDGKNDVTRFVHGGGIATTSYWYNGLNQLVEVNTVFNMTYGWGCCGEPNLHDVRNTMTHEFGHWLKLNDLPWPWDFLKTMYASAAVGETLKRSLDSDDINGLNYIYP